MHFIKKNLLKDAFVISAAFCIYYVSYIIARAIFSHGMFSLTTPILIGLLLLSFKFIKTSGAQYFNIIFLSIISGLYLTECYLIHGSNTKTKAPNRYISINSPLGYKPALREFNISKFYKKTKKSIYNITYKIDKNGLRITPNINPNGSSYLFYGGSFTYGEGLEANQTLPAQFAALTKGEHNIVNFGFEGYGPHQMLRNLELSTEDAYVKKDVKAVFYQLIDHHTNRAAGKIAWGVNSPLYTIDDHNNLIHQGPIHSKFSLIPLLKQSQIYHNILGPAIGSNQADLDRLIAILRQSKSIISQKYDAEFYVILWLSEHYPYMDEMKSRLEKEFNVIWVPTLLPLAPTEDWSQKYSILGDGHPNAYAYQLIAEHLVICCLNQK